MKLFVGILLLTTLVLRTNADFEVSAQAFTKNEFKALYELMVQYKYGRADNCPTVIKYDAQPIEDGDDLLIRHRDMKIGDNGLVNCTDAGAQRVTPSGKLTGERLADFIDSIDGNLDKRTVFEGLQSELAGKRYYVSVADAARTCGDSRWFEQGETFFYFDESKTIRLTVVAKVTGGEPKFLSLPLVGNIRYMIAVTTGTSCIYRVQTDVANVILGSARPSDSPSSTPRPSISPTPSVSASSVPIPSSTPSAVPSESASTSPTASLSPSVSMSQTNSPMPSVSSSSSPSESSTSSPSVSSKPSPSASVSQTTSPIPSVSSTSSPSVSSSPAPLVPSSSSPSVSSSPLPSVSSSPLPSVSSSPFPSLSSSPFPSLSSSSSPSVSSSPPPSSSSNPSPSVSSSSSQSVSPSLSISESPRAPLSPTAAPLMSTTASSTASPSNSVLPSSTPSTSGSPSSTPSTTPTRSSSPGPLDTPTMTPSSSTTMTPSREPTRTPIPTSPVPSTLISLTPEKSLTPTRTPIAVPTTDVSPFPSPSVTASPSKGSQSIALGSATPSTTPSSLLVPIGSATPTNSPTPSGIILGVDPGNLGSDDRNSSSVDGTSTCFPASGLVQGLNGVVKMDELRIGDYVWSGSEFSKVMMFTHRNSFTYAGFVRLKTVNGSITLTGGHYVYVNGGLSAARDVKIGDMLSSGVVIGKKDVVERGLFNPHTESGEIVVDGVLTSCYTDAVIPVVGHALLSPLRLVQDTIPGMVEWLGSWIEGVVDGRSA